MSDPLKAAKEILWEMDQQEKYHSMAEELRRNDKPKLWDTIKLIIKLSPPALKLIYYIVKLLDLLGVTDDTEHN